MKVQKSGDKYVLISQTSDEEKMLEEIDGKNVFVVPQKSAPTESRPSLPVQD